jgi:WD40 repeat protein
MNIEDRLRSATRARADLVDGIRPLTLPEDPPADPRDARRRGTWLIPAAAAAAVVVIAVALVAVRQLGPSRPAQAPSASSATVPSAAVPSSGSETVPRYYAAVAGIDGTSGVIVGDDRTGRPVAAVVPPSGQLFVSVSAAADDRTFVVTSQQGQGAGRPYGFNLLRIAPGTAHPATLTKLPVKPVSGFDAAALSPDGRELAVLATQDNATTLRTYSVPSGTLLRTWTGRPHPDGYSAVGLNTLSWLANGTQLAFTAAVAQNVLEELLVDVTAPGGDLAARSHSIFAVDQPGRNPCLTLTVTPDGGTVICGRTYTPAGTRAAAMAGCATQGPAFVTYSVRTGKPVRTLYQYQKACLSGSAVPLWTDSSGQQVVGWLGTVASTGSAQQAEVGLAAGGRFSQLPVSAQALQSYQIAF